MERMLGLKTLREDLATLSSKDQFLAIDLRDRDPEEAFSSVPYEKGRLFLTYLDAKFGRERFDAFVRGYFDHFSSKSITSEQFVNYLRDNLLDRFPGIVTRDQAMAWIGGPGIPPDAVLPSAVDAFAEVDAARTAWTGGQIAAKKLESRAWVAQQWIYFLDDMPAELSTAQIAELDQTFGFARSANAEVVQRWLLLAIRHQYQPGFVRLEQYLKTIGRGRLIAPLYVEMMKTPAGATQARRVYALARPHYHPAAAAAIDAIVNPPADSPETADE